ncbi:TRAP transporter small permease [Paenibacillus sp. J2TS4]|uniref:TRAP transporter small permease n=1 Tax=Paenibacillus sp. J2TS4 TaxID=2807194 RepID=UPI001B12739A|nr:TRAP transporter small permease [Paenibacillus sp. J2TS4]GIP34327.1 C4-dicarboxylate ABC transporter permease [Paenibacillus sp. J2TS4]
MITDSEKGPVGKSSVLEKLEIGFLAIVMMVMTALVLAQVFYRFFMESSLTWSEELVRFLMIWMTFFGAVIALRQNLHIQIDNLIVKLPVKAKVVFLIIRSAAMLVFLGLMMAGSFSLLEIAGFQTSPGLSIKMSYVYSVIPITAALMMLITIIRLWTDIKQAVSDKKSQPNGGTL